MLKNVQIVAAMFLSVTAALAVASEISRDLPPHPTVIYAEFKGERFPVVAVKKEQPIIIVRGERKVLPRNTQLSAERSSSFLGPSVKLEPKSAGEPGIMPWGMDWRPEFQATATHKLEDCFVAFIQFDEEFFMNPEELRESRTKRADLRPDRPVESPHLRLQEIPNLEAGVPTIFSLNASLRGDSYWTNMPAAVDTRMRLYFFTLVFAGGVEVESRQPPHAARYFHHREKLMHRSLLRRWLEQNKAASQPVRPILQIPFQIARSGDQATDAVATLVVSADGTVQDVSLEPNLPAEADKVVRDALAAWLFLPKLNQGKPVATTVKLPLQF